MAEMQRAKNMEEMTNILDKMPPVPNDHIDVSRRRLKLSDIMGAADYWRIYLDRYHHGPALKQFQCGDLKDPGSFYDEDRSPGFKDSMVEAYKDVLDGNVYAEEFTSGILTFDQYKNLFDRTSKYILNKNNLRPRRDGEQAEFGIDPATVASDAGTEFLSGTENRKPDLLAQRFNAQHKYEPGQV